MAINDWKSIEDCPVIKTEQNWDLNDLERILQNTILETSRIAAEMNVAERLKNQIRLCDELEPEIFMGLSGGLDSTFCLSQMQKYCYENSAGSIFTYAVGPHEKYPDIQYARAISILFGTTHHELVLDKENRAKNLKEFHQLFPEPRFPGDEAVYRFFKELAIDNCYAVICCDGIDELLGGYWPHRDARGNIEKLIHVFEKFWTELFTAHLSPLQRTADHFGIKLFFPFLQRSVVEFISHIPVIDRCPALMHGKAPLRKIAAKYIPEQIILRNKRGFGQALDPWP